jgi:hypothetical protein
MRFSGHAPALFIRAPLAVLLVASAQLDALVPRQPRIDALRDHGALELCKDAAHLEHGLA